ncbi:hypothetical protein BC830DRAFT_1077251 [Chytriomyces sp. MP71]|nr:hypothetical protein BC830DRAFT_1077251 [Chytriomyces sp. MP71]
MILKSENDRGKEDVKWSISQAVVHAQGNGKSRKLTPDARIHIALHDKDNEDCDSGMLFEPDSPLAHRTRSRLAAQSDLPFASRWREGASHSPITKVLKSVRKRSMLFKSSKKDLPGKKSPPAAKVMKKNAGGTVASVALFPQQLNTTFSRWDVTVKRQCAQFGGLNLEIRIISRGAKKILELAPPPSPSHHQTHLDHSLGMFNALNSIEDESPGVRKIKSLCTALLYLSFSVFSLIAGGLNNLLGPRVLLVFGAATYALFVASKYAVHVADIANPLGQWNGSLPMSGPRSGNGSWNVKNATVSHESLDGTVSGNHNGATQGWNGTQSNWTQWEAGYQSSFMAQTYFAYTSSVLLGMGAVSTVAVWGSAIVYQYYIDDFADHSLAFYDTSSENWVYWPFGLTIYIFFGLFDAFYQSYTYWLIGSLSHDAAINSRYAGFYKSIQSLFAAISWILGDTELSTQFPNVFRPIDISDMAWIGISVGPLVASCVCFAFFVHFYVTDFAEEDEWVEMDEEKV